MLIINIILMLFFNLSYFLCENNEKIFLTCERLNKTKLFYLENQLNISVEVTHFDNFNNLVDVCNSSLVSTFTTFIPSKSTIIDQPLSNLSKLISDNVQFLNLKGFKVDLPPFSATSLNWMVVSYSKLDLFYKDQIVTTSCSNLQNQTGNNYRLFNNINNLRFHYIYKYSKNTCPAFFNNSNFQSLRIENLSNTIINSNYLTFYEFPDNRSINLNILASRLYLSLYRVDVGKNLIFNEIYTNLTFLEIQGYLLKFDLNSITNNLKVLRFTPSISDYLYQGYDYLGYCPMSCQLSCNYDDMRERCSIQSLNIDVRNFFKLTTI